MQVIEQAVKATGTLDDGKQLLSCARRGPTN